MDWKKTVTIGGLAVGIILISVGISYLLTLNLTNKSISLEEKISKLENSLAKITSQKSPILPTTPVTIPPNTPNNVTLPPVSDFLAADLDFIRYTIATIAGATAQNSKTISTISPTGTIYPNEFYIPMGSGVTTQEGRWIDVGSAQAIIDTASYPIIKAVYFESVLRLPNAQGEIRARLVETTLPYVYSGNEVRSQSGTGELVSSRINLQPGKRTYKVQLYSSIGQGALDFARIRVVVR